jgi:alkaline phosphatase
VNDHFCPGVTVTRGQLAAFLVRALGLTDDGGGNSFVDDDGSIFEADIARLAAAGITAGCNPPTNDRYCPDEPVTRGQLAAFLVRAMGYTDSGSGNLFIDDDGLVFEQDIDRLGTAGVTTGCNPPRNDRYCPGDPVKRDQMASFLARALGLGPIVPTSTSTSTSTSTTTTTTSTTTTSTTSTTAPPATVSVLAVGDIADEPDCGEITAAVVDDYPDIPVLALGDLAYPDGSADDFADCYGRNWGQFDDRVYPVPGNHEYHSADAGPYFDYFGPRAGVEGEGWYSFDLSAWHIIALNSEEPMEVGSLQHTWLVEDLATSSSLCTLAYWHTPRWMVGWHEPESTKSEDIWGALEAADADIVLGGHDHNYQRWAPQNAAGEPVADGIRQFVVGTGGNGLYPQEFTDPQLELFYGDSYGVLKLDLAPDSYAWEFLEAEGGAFTDTGSGTCH